VGTPPPPSDLQLLQEYYAHDAWQLLVACVLMSRVSVHTRRFEECRNLVFVWSLTN
jgi:hypothetical protein